MIYLVYVIRVYIQKRGTNERFICESIINLCNAMPGSCIIIALTFDIVKWIQFIVSTEKSNMKIVIVN